MMHALRGVVSGRKLRLFVVAFCRSAQRFIKHPLCKGAVELAEEFADGSISAPSLDAVNRAVWQLPPDVWEREFAWNVTRKAIWDGARWINMRGIRTRGAEAQAELIREVFGNPFQPVFFDGARACNGGTVSLIADSIYADRAFDRLPILADALEDAGCTDAAILEHCRGPGPHVRGCWVVDLLLGKS
jgi:hypothetical protein